MEKNKKIALALIILIATIMFVLIPTFAKATINPNDYKPSNPSSGDVSTITQIVNPIIEVIKIVGVIVAVVCIILLGVKYMAGSVNEKAEFKKSMIPYLIGAVLSVSITQILGVIIEVITNVK